jgi:hypothetical protein
MKTIKFYQLTRRNFDFSDTNMIIKNKGVTAFVTAEKGGKFTINVGAESDGSPIVFLTHSMTIQELKVFIKRLSECWLKSDYSDFNYCRVYPKNSLFENMMKFSETKAVEYWKRYFKFIKK